MPSDAQAGRTTYRYPWSFQPGDRPGPVVATVVDDCRGRSTGEAVWLRGERVEGSSAAVHQRIEAGLAMFLSRWKVSFEPTPLHADTRPDGGCDVCAHASGSSDPAPF